MLPKLARITLAFICFPLLGAYSLAWVAAYTADLAGIAGLRSPVLPWLDLAGAAIGFGIGLLLAIQIIGCCMQSEVSPVRAPGDNILIVLGITLLADAVLLRMLGQQPAVTQWLQPASLAIWGGCGAATLSLARMRRHYRAQPSRPTPTAPPTQGNM